jgi:hypothetical protein
MIKSYSLKIYGFDGTYIKTIKSNQIMSDPKFNSKTKGGQGQCVIDLNLPFDDFDEGVSIKGMNVVKIFERDDIFNQTPVLIYTGFISQYKPFVNGSNEGVTLILLGLVSMLSYGFYRTGGGSDVVTVVSEDPADVLGEIIDHFNTIYPGGWLSHGSNNVALGAVINYTFTKQKWLDSITQTFELAEGGRYFTIRENGELYYKDFPATPTHRLTIGDNIDVANILKNTEKIINRVVLQWASGTNTYDDVPSQTDYGVREVFIKELAVGDLTTADNYAAGVLAQSKDPKIEAKMHINNRYNIESIHPGDTCSIFNYKNNGQLFDLNMIITSVSYTPDGVDIELNNNLPGFADLFRSHVIKIVDGIVN